MSKISATTVADFPVHIHTTWAEGQETYKAQEFADAAHIPQHASIAVTRSDFISETRVLTGIDESPSAWCHTKAPEGYGSQSNRFFSQGRLFPSKWGQREEARLLRDIIVPQCEERHAKALSALANTLENTVELLDALTAQTERMKKA